MLENTRSNGLENEKKFLILYEFRKIDSPNKVLAQIDRAGHGMQPRRAISKM